MVIFFVFWLSYALARSVILERSESFTFDDLRHFVIPYFEMYGEMFVSPMEANGTNHIQFRIDHFSSIVFMVFDSNIVKWKSVKMSRNLLLIFFFKSTSSLKLDLHTPTLSADFWNSPSKLRQNLASMQWFLRFWKICEQVTDFGPTCAWVLLGNLKDFESVDKVGVCNFGLRLLNTPIKPCVKNCCRKEDWVRF